MRGSHTQDGCREQNIKEKSFVCRNPWERYQGPKGSECDYLYRWSKLWRGGILGEQFTNSLGKLGTVAGPIGDAVVLQVHAGRIGAGIVGANNFYRTAITGTVFFNNNDAVVGLLARSNTR